MQQQLLLLLSIEGGLLCKQWLPFVLRFIVNVFITSGVMAIMLFAALMEDVLWTGR